MDRANSHTKAYNIPRSFEAMHMNGIKYELRAWVTCVAFSSNFNVVQNVAEFDLTCSVKLSILPQLGFMYALVSVKRITD